MVRFHLYPTSVQSFSTRATFGPGDRHLHWKSEAFGKPQKCDDRVDHKQTKTTPSKHIIFSIGQLQRRRLPCLPYLPYIPYLTYLAYIARPQTYHTLHYSTLQYITLHYITLHYITLHYIKSNQTKIQLNEIASPYIPYRSLELCDFCQSKTDSSQAEKLFHRNPFHHSHWDEKSLPLRDFYGSGQTSHPKWWLQWWRSIWAHVRTYILVCLKQTNVFKIECRDGLRVYSFHGYSGKKKSQQLLFWSAFGKWRKQWHWMVMLSPKDQSFALPMTESCVHKVGKVHFGWCV